MSEVAVPDVADLAHRVERLHELVRSLTTIVTRQPASAALPLPRWNWDGLNPASTREAWRDLETWTAWLVIRYELVDEWPTCWFCHSELVAWTLALRSWHRAVYAPEYEVMAGAEVATLAPTTPRFYWEWHTQGLVPFLVRLRESAKGCSGGARHREPSEEVSRQRCQRLAAGRAAFAAHLAALDA